MNLLVRVSVFVLSLSAIGCDLLNQTAVIPPEPSDLSVPRPLALSQPDSVLKLLTYLFHHHRPKDADEYGDILYSGYVYRYVDPTDEHDLFLRRDEELQICKRLFAFYEEISAEFSVEDRWTEYGANRSIPTGTPAFEISNEHPDENWVVLKVFGEMSFTYTNNEAARVGADVRQLFDIAFRLDPTRKDSTWQIASWTDLAPLYPAKLTAGDGRR